MEEYSQVNIASLVWAQMLQMFPMLHENSVYNMSPERDLMYLPRKTSWPVERLSGLVRSVSVNLFRCTPVPSPAALRGWIVRFLWSCELWKRIVLYVTCKMTSYNTHIHVTNRSFPSPRKLLEKITSIARIYNQPTNGPLLEINDSSFCNAHPIYWHYH